jgi:hypothetical protein
LKYCPSIKKLTKKEQNQVLASLAWKRLTNEEVDNTLAKTADKKLSPAEIYKIKTLSGQEKNSEAKMIQLLAEAIMNSLPRAEIDQILAAAVKLKLTDDEIAEAFQEEAAATEDLSSEQIDHYLTKAAMDAINDVIKKDYHGPIGYMAEDIIDLGVAIYGYGLEIKAIFASKESSA